MQNYTQIDNPKYQNGGDIKKEIVERTLKKDTITSGQRINKYACLHFLNYFFILFSPFSPQDAQQINNLTDQIVMVDTLRKNMWSEH